MEGTGKREDRGTEREREGWGRGHDREMVVKGRGGGRERQRQRDRQKGGRTGGGRSHSSLTLRDPSTCRQRENF